MKVKNHILVTLIAGLVISGLSCSSKTEAQRNSDQNTNIIQSQSPNDKSINKDKIDTSKWKTYKDSKNGYSFRYPPNLILQRKGNRVRLHHSVKFRHQDPCDMRENSPALDKLVDFDVTFEIFNKNFEKLVQEKTGGVGVEQSLKNVDGDLQKTKSPSNPNKNSEDDDFTEVGKLKGEFFWRATGGCGSYEYVYPLKEEKTLAFEQQIISVFNPANTARGDDIRALKNPDVITPEKEIKIIREILESFDSTGN